MTKIDSSLKKYRSVQKEAAMVAAEFAHTNGVRIAAAAFWIEDQLNACHDDWESEAPYIVRQCCINEIDDAAEEKLEEGTEIRHYRAYVTLYDAYGENWPETALAAHYRHVANLDDAEEAAAKKWNAADEAYRALVTKVELDWLRAERTRTARAALTAAVQYKEALADYKESMAA